MAISDSTEELMTKSFWYEMNEVYTAMPCIVVEVVDDLKEQRVHVQPCLNKLLLDGSVSARSVILNVPVIFPSTSSSAITMPVNKNDIVWCNFSMRAMEIFNESDGKPSTPNNYAKFDQKDAVAFIGMTTKQTAINNPLKRTLAHSTKDLVVAHNLGKSSETEIRFKPNGDIVITTPTKITVNTPEAIINASTSATVTTPDLTVNADSTTWVGDISLTGNITQTGTIIATEVTASGKALSTHTHNQTGHEAGVPTLPPN